MSVLSSIRRKSVCAAFAFALVILSISTASAQNAFWDRSSEDGEGSWTDAVNWDLEGQDMVPGPTNSAIINNGGTALVDGEASAWRVLMGTLIGASGFINIVDGGSLTMDGSQSWIGGSSGATASITMTGGSFQYTNDSWVDFGRFGSGTLDVSGGEFSVGGDLRAAVFNHSGQGVINQSGGEINVARHLRILYGVPNTSVVPTGPASGTLIQTGGTINVVGRTQVAASTFGDDAAGTALYEIGAATLNTGEMFFGGADQGTLRIVDSAASINIGSYLGVGDSAVFEAVPGSVIRFTNPTGSLVENEGSPYFNLNVYFENRRDVADSSEVAGLANTTLVFAGGDLGGDGVGHFEVGGTDLGNIDAGYENNFSLAGLNIGDGSSVGNLKLIDLLSNGAPDATPQALYVDHLVVTAGSTLDLNGLNLYYKMADIDGTIIGGPAVTGDFNDDGQIDAADYVLWRTNPSSHGDAQGYADWVNNFGATLGSGSLASTPVPEPVSANLLAVVVASLVPFYRRRLQHIE